MPRKPQSISKNKVPEIAASLKTKAETPITITLEDLVRNLEKPIQEMLEAGYSYQDVSDVFASHGVELAASGIKNYHKKPQKRSRTEPPIPANQPNLAQPDSETEQQPLPDRINQVTKQSNKDTAKDKSEKSKFNITDRSQV